MTLEDLFAHVFEAIQDVEDRDVVVHGLTRQPFTCRVEMLKKNTKNAEGRPKV